MSGIQYAPDVDTVRLQAVLEQVLSRHFGGERSVRRLERRASAYSSSYAIEELDVCLDDGSRLAMIFKDLSPAASTECRQWVKPAFLCDARREIAVYRTLLSRVPLGTATYYGSLVSRRKKRYWLFLERVGGVPLWQVGELRVWEEAARWLARMHIQVMQVYEHIPSHVHKRWLHYDEAYYRRWVRRAVQYVRRRDPASLEGFRFVVDRYGRWVDRLAALPIAFIHGEFYPSNVLVQEGEDGVRICPVDWEMAAVGPALMDLGALTAGHWTRNERVAMVTAYRDAFVEEQGGALDLDVLMAGLDACQLFQAVQWLGWSLRWDPPPEHARDWLNEAYILADRLAF